METDRIFINQKNEQRQKFIICSCKEFVYSS